jgi:hypothetical protein
MTRIQRLAAGAAVCAIASAAGTAVYAQQTTSGMHGVVRDSNGAPVANATVMIVYGPADARRVAQTDAGGEFDAQGLRVGGPYKVTASKSGLRDQTISDLSLSVGVIERLTLTMAPAGEVSELIVTAARQATTSEQANVGSRTTLTRTQIESAVSVRRDIRDLARRDPLTQLDFATRGTGPTGGIYIAGSLPRSNRITIDGVRSSDTFGINTGGLSTNRGPVSFEAIEQVTVQATPSDVEDGDFTGGAVNIILRSGGNKLHGSAFDLIRKTRWTGDELPIVGFPGGDVTQPPLTGYRHISNKVDEKNYGFFLSGPIWTDHIFFAGAYEKYTTTSPITLGPADGGFANTYAKIPGISTGSNATLADINAVLANWTPYAASTSLAPGSFPNSKPLIDEKYSLKIDYDIADGQRLSGTYRKAKSSVWKPNTSSSFINPDSAWYVQAEVEDNYALQLNSQWTPAFSTEGRITYRKYTRGQTPPEGQGFSQIQICPDAASAGGLTACSSGVPVVQFGPDQFRQANVLATKEWTGELIGRYRLNNHLIKAGWQFRDMDIYNLFLQQAHGIYYFDSIADVAAGRANRLQVANSLTGNAPDAAATPKYRVDSLLLQDSWDVSPELSANYGLRYDRYSSSKAPTLNTNFVNRYGFSNQKDYDGLSILMPRFSAKYKTDRFEVGGGFGLFSGGLPDVFLANSYGATTGALTNAIDIQRQADGSFLERNSGVTLDPVTGAAILNINKSDATFVNSTSPLIQSLITADSAARRNAFTNSLAPNFRMPQDWKANVTFRTHWQGVEFGVDGVYSRSRVNVAFRDIRARLLTVNGVQQYTPDGRLRYDGLVVPGATPAIINANRAAAGLPVSTNPDLANLSLNGDIQVYNPDIQNWSRTIAFSAARDWDLRDWGDIDLFAAYTLQDGRTYGGITEFATTAGGNTTSGAFYPDQSFDYDPNAATKGKSSNLIRKALKVNVSYKFEPRPGWISRITLFGEHHNGRPFSLLMADVSGTARNPTFGVSRDDALVYVPNLSSPDPTNPLKFTTGATKVFFDSAASLAKFTALVNQFGLPQGKIVPRGFGKNPSVSHFDLQFAQTVPLPVEGHSVLVTLDFANIGNLLSRKWGVVKEYTGARAGGVIVNAQCATAAGAAAAVGSPVCDAYRYSYTTSTASPGTVATPTIDPVASLWSVELGLKYRF